MENKTWEQGGGFSYGNTQTNKNKETIFGVEWSYTAQAIKDGPGDKDLHPSERGYYFCFDSKEYGKFYISASAEYKIQEIDNYKFLALIFEHNKKRGDKLLIIANDEHKDLFTAHFPVDTNIILTIDELLHEFPITLSEKQQRALHTLYMLYPDYGTQIETINEYMFFAKNIQEHDFILSSITNKNWVTKTGSKTYKISDNGWKQLDEVIKVRNNKQVFIAMKFKDMDSIKFAIKNAIKSTGLTPNRIDEKQHINNISSEIQHDIKQSGLVIADLTCQNQGVYFEAGYAMGLNIPVVFCCREKDKDEIHFDICQYNTIFYKDENELEIKLKYRIVALMNLQNKYIGEIQ